MSNISIEELEKHLKIEPFDYIKHNGKDLQNIIFNNWEEVADFLKEQRDQAKYRVDLFFTCYGYEFITHNNENCIMINYTNKHSFS